FLIARSIVSPGILAALAAASAVRSRGFAFTSLPPMRAAIVRSLMSLVKARPRRASLRAFLCLIVLHLEWPDMAISSRQRSPGYCYHIPVKEKTSREPADKRYVICR